MKRPAEAAHRVLWTAVFAAAFGFVEAAVVVYLRALYYPEGFQFPLRLMAPGMIPVELTRELATLIMLASVGILAGRSRWDRFGAFMVAFGVWDIAFYLWLRFLVAWPATIVDWDILFLLPLPWIGPVLAPVLIALVMTVGGAWMMTVSGRGERFHITPQPVALALAGTAILLYSFMHDTGATLHGAMPAPYSYPLLGIGLACYVASFVFLKRLPPPQNT
ncbi:MAG TPA: hypothetical protein VF889_08610 [Bacteroidota bacterium]